MSRRVRITVIKLCYEDDSNWFSWISDVIVPFRKRSCFPLHSRESIYSSTVIGWTDSHKTSEFLFSWGSYQYVRCLISVLLRKTMGVLTGGLAASIRIALLAMIGYAAYDIRLYAIKDYGLVIHEFDPWFNFRATQYLADNGLAKFFSWYAVHPIFFEYIVLHRASSSSCLLLFL